MEIPAPPQAIAALAGFVRDRLVDVGESIAPLLARRDEVSPSGAIGSAERSVTSAARQVASAIVTAAAPFAPNSYSRTRLIRQMHASGLLSADEARRAGAVLDLDEQRSGAAR